jgi:hypothetical protein
MKPTVGRIVHYTLAPDDLDEKHQHQVGRIRPAVIVETHGNEKFGAFQSGSAVNLQVFRDGSNDGPHGGMFWKTSVLFTEHQSDLGMWSWPPRVD